MHDADDGHSLTFIDVGEPSAQRRKRNANQARSIVMTARRRRQRQEKNNKSHVRGKPTGVESNGHEHELDALCGQTQNRSPKFLLKPMDPEFAEIFWDACLTKSMQLETLSSASMLEQDIVALRGYDKPVTLHLHKLINHVIRTMWPKYWPAKNNGEASPLAIAWWPLFVNVPAVFHAFLYAAAVHHDDLRGHSDMSQSREILTHKSEALHQLQLALAHNKSLDTMDDALVLAMAYLGMEAEGYNRDQPVSEPIAFNAPMILRSIQWVRHYAYAKENVHIQAAMRLVDLKGGLDNLSQPLAKSVFINDLQISSKYVRKPRYPYWDVPDLLQGMYDPDINVISEDELPSATRCGFQELRCLGLTDELYGLMMRARMVSSKVELYTAGKLRNPDFHLLSAHKNFVHHSLLSLPTAKERGLEDQERDMYECGRIGGLLYSNGVLFPVLPSSGTPSLLVEMSKQMMQDLRFETCTQGGAKILLWVLVLSTIMAQNTVERPWFLRRMKPILAMEGAQSWDALKKILKTFLWMDSACDEAAQGLYEDLSRPPYL